MLLDVCFEHLWWCTAYKFYWELVPRKCRLCKVWIFQLLCVAVPHCIALRVIFFQQYYLFWNVHFLGLIFCFGLAFVIKLSMERAGTSPATPRPLWRRMFSFRVWRLEARVGIFRFSLILVIEPGLHEVYQSPQINRTAQRLCCLLSYACLSQNLGTKLEY